MGVKCFFVKVHDVTYGKKLIKFLGAASEMVPIDSKFGVSFRPHLIGKGRSKETIVFIQCMGEKDELVSILGGLFGFQPIPFFGAEKTNRFLPFALVEIAYKQRRR